MSIDKYETLNQERKIQHTKRKVAAYCRVSTDNEDQANSFESQQRYFRQYIERNPIGSFMKCSQMKASLVRIQKNGKNLTA